MARISVNGHGLHQEKLAMLAQLRSEVSDSGVLAAMECVPRERFLPASVGFLAYHDTALAIGFGQTISQPLMVATMTSVLAPNTGDKVLEVGTGSGYQAAVLAELARWVVTVELVPELVRSAASTLTDLGYGHCVTVRLAGAELGCPEEAPFDRILVTAAAPKVPGSLLRQLAPGGSLVVPVGTRNEQVLLRVLKGPDGFHITRHGACRFVPLLGKDGWLSELG